MCSLGFHPLSPALNLSLASRFRLLEKKAELNKQDTKLNTPMMHATWHQVQWHTTLMLTIAILTLNLSSRLCYHPQVDTKCGHGTKLKFKAQL